MPEVRHDALREGARMQAIFGFIPCIPCIPWFLISGGQAWRRSHALQQLSQLAFDLIGGGVIQRDADLLEEDLTPSLPQAEDMRAHGAFAAASRWAISV
jgi:hypothetical protein